MNRRLKLLEKALNDPGSLRFQEARRLAENFGFELRRVRGSHHIFTRDGFDGVLNLQIDKGLAKDYQVRQLLAALRDLNLIQEEPDTNE
ncbi:MAG: type II toxin-antitoxin system HicA family toxin [Candidatus Eisenbacteria bacterium]|uniref:Type II toxin-antitoxin system HicA family toxin n=1 Tax=Eiseniibacteriota bacterium TaxID=2212470 RepID=A0A948W4M0_UNCEI|nr:type II toxin-antitoxin system HicA family toxin [Candidatus Eisenbacteria bacterium]MBU1949112.1 type II toxin-antitoxin system HicA family toxin [Candidatus Eisenbacteria bacterium]MBU2692377.1 type II toxin-antitoxin system HicA family toxin [Candidatus Eisenbacteria bacterium]